TISIQAGNYLEIVKKNPQQSSLVGNGDVSRNGYMGDDELPSMRGGGAIGKEIFASSAGSRRLIPIARKSREACFLLSALHGNGRATASRNGEGAELGTETCI
ncbi:MAG: hypothetical protein PHQ41_03830, partial [Candidatus Cloacimonetes bacterium]|nr:hypothetical protein [Candidatus Cloacimonadota bacterium]